MTDDILIAGFIPDLYTFAKVISGRYRVRKVIIDNDVQFNGCEISQDVLGNIRMDISAFLDKLEPIPITKQRRKEVHEKATKEETEMFRSMAGAILWIGSAVMPQAACIASFMQQKVTRLVVQDLIDANARLNELRDIKAWIKYIAETVDSCLRQFLLYCSWCPLNFEAWVVCSTS